MVDVTRFMVKDTFILYNPLFVVVIYFFKKNAGQSVILKIVSIC